MKKLTIWQKLASETPADWKRAQIICLVLESLVIKSMTIPAMLPYSNILVFVAGGLAFLAAGAQAAVKYAPEVSELVSSPGLIADHGADILAAVQNIQTYFTSNTAAPAPTTDEIKQEVSELESLPGASSPVINPDKVSL